MAGEKRLDQLLREMKSIVSQMEKEMREKVDPRLYESVDTPKVKSMPTGKRERVEAAFQVSIDAVEILSGRLPDLKERMAEVSKESGAWLDFDSLERALKKFIREARIDLNSIRMKA